MTIHLHSKKITRYTPRDKDLGALYTYSFPQRSLPRDISGQGRNPSVRFTREIGPETGNYWPVCVQSLSLSLSFVGEEIFENWITHAARGSQSEKVIWPKAPKSLATRKRGGNFPLKRLIDRENNIEISYDWFETGENKARKTDDSTVADKPVSTQTIHN